MAPVIITGALRRTRDIALQPGDATAHRPILLFVTLCALADEALVEAMIALKKTPSPFVGVFLVTDPNVRSVRGIRYVGVW
jgi:hypothetical protein